jgi:hypothetical protein
VPAGERAQRQALSGERGIAPVGAVPIHPEDPYLVNGVKLVNGDCDCRGFIWLWACTESPLVFNRRREEPLPGHPGRASPADPDLREFLDRWAFHRPAVWICAGS